MNILQLASGPWLIACTGFDWCERPPIQCAPGHGHEAVAMCMASDSECSLFAGLVRPWPCLDQFFLDFDSTFISIL